MTVRVVVGGRLPEERLEEVRAAAGNAAGVVAPRDDEHLVQEVAGAEVYLAGPFDARLLAAARALKWVHATGAGVERQLFPEFVERDDVVFTNSRGAHHVAMPEYVLMAMLSWAGHLPALLRAQTRHEWIKPVPEEIHGKTLGLLGYGEIGRATAARARALGVRCVALRRNPAEANGAELVERTYAPDELDAFLAAADYVVNSLPLTAETRGLIGAVELRAMRPTAVMIQLGRGPTIQEEALLDALRNGTIAGAFLDVFDEEPLPADSPFWDLENAIVTCHTSGFSVHYQERAVAIFCDNLRRYLRGDALRNVVDKRLGY